MDRRAFLSLTNGRTLAVAAATAADQALDVQVLQTAASVEYAMIGAYETMLGLALFTSNSANPVLKNLLTTARAQHTEHAGAYNAIATALGGKAQTGANSNLAQAVTRAKAGLTDIGPAVELALLLESTAAQTFQNDLGLLTDVNARRLTGSVLAVESQHVGLLLIAKALLGARALELVSLEAGTRDKLPADAAKAGFPVSIAKTDQARPSSEGAVK